MHSKHSNNPNPFDILAESLNYKDLEGMVKPTIHVDEFSSKMGDDDDIITVSFFVRNNEAAKDLMNWFERGYDFVLDADKSPGEIKPNRYLVYIELRRRSSAGAQISEILDDLSTLTEFEPKDWSMHYDNKDVPFSREEFERVIPLSPKEYRRRYEEDLNEMRIAAGVQPKEIHDKTSPEIQAIQSAAGIL